MDCASRHGDVTMLSETVATKVRSVKRRGDTTVVEIEATAVDMSVVSSLMDEIAKTRARARALVAVGPAHVAEKSIRNITAGEIKRFTKVISVKDEPKSGKTVTKVVTVEVNS